MAEISVPTATISVGEEVQPVADALAAEQHDAEEARLEEEGGQHLVAHQRPDHRPGLVGEGRPVGAELVAHDDAGDDAHAEGDGEDGLPVVEELADRPRPCFHSQSAFSTAR